MNIRIRKATVSDIPTLVGFQMKLASETEGIELDPQTLEKGMTAMFEDPSKGFYNIAEINKETVGCHMVTYEWSDWRNGQVYWLQSVYVEERSRQHGVFRAMFRLLKEQVMSDPGIAGLRLYVDKSNGRAQNVYASMGMNGDHYTVFEWMKG